MLKWVKTTEPLYKHLEDEEKTGEEKAGEVRTGEVKAENEITAHSCLRHPTYAFKAIVFLSHDPKDLAEQMTILDSFSLKLIQPAEFKSFGWMAKQNYSRSPNVVDFLDIWKALSKWVLDLCMRSATPQARANLIRHFIELAEALEKLNNFHSSSAIVDGLQSAPIQRLEKSWSRVPSEKIEQFTKLRSLFTSNSKYKEVFQNVLKSKAPLRCVPNLNVFVKSLAYLDNKLRSFRPFTNYFHQSRLNKEYDTMDRIQKDSNYSNIREIPPVLNYVISILVFTRDLARCSTTYYNEKSFQLEPPEGN